MTAELLEIAKIAVPSIAVYVAIRVDIATLMVRMQRVEKDIEKLAA